MRLSVQIEFDKTLDLETHKKSVVVGRSPQSDLVIPHEGVSRSHCKIELKDGQFYITDLESSNGVFIDGQRLPPRKRVAFINSQQLRLGTLECEVIESAPNKTDHKIESMQLANGGDYTATIRVARIDLNKVPQRTLELEKKVKPNKPRNPVLPNDQKEDVVESTNKRPYIIMLMILVLAATWYFTRDMK